MYRLNGSGSFSASVPAAGSVTSGLVAAQGDADRLEGDARIFGDIKERVAPEMVVAYRDARVDAGRIDRDADRRRFEMQRIERDVGVPLGEESVRAQQASVGDEIDLAVVLVDDVRLGRHCQTGGRQDGEKQGKCGDA